MLSQCCLVLHASCKSMHKRTRRAYLWVSSVSNMPKAIMHWILRLSLLSKRSPISLNRCATTLGSAPFVPLAISTTSRAKASLVSSCSCFDCP